MYLAAIKLVLISFVYNVAGGPQLAQSSTSSTSGSGSRRVVSSGTENFDSRSSGSTASGSASSRFVSGSGSQFGGSSSFGSSGTSSGSSGFDSIVTSGSSSGSNADSGSDVGSAFGSAPSSGFVQNVGGTVSGSSGAQFVNSGPQFIVNSGQPGQSSQEGRFFANFLQQLTITVTETRTIDNYVTVTETILNSVPVTITGFNVNTVTLTTFGVHQTEVDDVVALTTTVVERPVTEFVTTAKSNFIYVTDVSVEVYTITHNAHLITQTVHTTVVTQTLTMSSPVVRTFLTTATETSTEHRTVVNTVFVHGYV
ncbi:protein rtoA-like [Palaemon carinicauda]|uniref:protein rtoA-like n=1 Tax=Palaemon carinicauda TaxID=392227 RepID=UPI0035B5E626